MSTNLVLQIGSTFNCHNLADPLSLALAKAGISAGTQTSSPEDLSQHMLAPAPDSEGIAGTLILVRVEDWLRGSMPADDRVARRELKTNLDEFLSEVSVLGMRGRPVWLVVCPSAGWVADEFKLVSLCRTYTNLLAARLRNLPQITLLTWPESLSNEDCYDREQDRTSLIPFRSNAFEQLATSLGNQLARIFAVGDSTAISSVRQTGSPELANFLAGLGVRVSVTAAKPGDSADVGRILRTAASFSLAGEKPALTDADADAIVGSRDCWLVRVSDRLSDFGTSGVIVARTENGTLVVGTLSLSCTVLGKQVEFALLRALKEMAASRDLPTVAFEYHDSGRNQPALAFLKSVATENGNHLYVLPVDETETRVDKAAVAPGAWAVTVER